MSNQININLSFFFKLYFNKIRDKLKKKQYINFNVVKRIRLGT